MDEFEQEFGDVLIGQDAGQETSVAPADASFDDEFADVLLPDSAPADNGLNKLQSGLNSYAQGLGKMFSSIPKTIGEVSAWATDDNPELSDFYRAGVDLDQWITDHFPINPIYADEFWSHLASGAGSLTGFAAGGLLGGVVKGGRLAVPALLGASATSSEGVDEYKQIMAQRGEDIDIDTRQSVAFWNGLTGTTEALSVYWGLNRLDRMSGGVLRKGLVERIGKLPGRAKGAAFVGAAGVAGAIEESAQEAFQSVMKNVIAQGYYDPERNTWTDDSTTGAQVGGVLGFTMSVITSSLGMRKIRPKSEVTAEKEAVDQAIKDEQKAYDESLKNGADSAEAQKHEQNLSDLQDKRSTLDLEETLSPADEDVAEKDIILKDEKVHEGTDVPEGAQHAGAIIGVEENQAQEQTEENAAGIPAQNEEKDDTRQQEPPTEPDAIGQEEVNSHSGGEVTVDQNQSDSQTETDSTAYEHNTYVVGSDGSLGWVKQGAKPDNNGNLNAYVPGEKPGSLVDGTVQAEGVQPLTYQFREAFPPLRRVSTPWGEGTVINNDLKAPDSDKSLPTAVEVQLDSGEQFQTLTPFLKHLPETRSIGQLRRTARALREQGLTDDADLVEQIREAIKSKQPSAEFSYGEKGEYTLSLTKEGRHSPKEMIHALRYFDIKCGTTLRKAGRRSRTKPKSEIQTRNGNR